MAISTETEESTNSSSDAGGGDVTVASNLPDQENGNGGDSSSSQNSETRERVNYEVSETEREIIRAPGAIKRVTVAVLVNEPTITDAAGQTQPAPREEAELLALRELVSSAVGFDESRGDIITIKSMALQSVPPIGTLAGTSLMDRFNFDIMSTIQMIVLAAVTLVLGLFVVRPLLSKEPAPALPEPAGLPPLGEGTETALSGEVTSDSFDLPDLTAEPVFGGDLPALPDLPMMGGPSTEAPVDRVREMISERQDETVEILRSWLEDKEENV